MSNAFTVIVALSCAVAGAAGGAALHATLTGQVAVACQPAQADDGDLNRFFARPAPAPTGSPRY